MADIEQPVAIAPGYTAPMEYTGPMKGQGVTSVIYLPKINTMSPNKLHTNSKTCDSFWGFQFVVVDNVFSKSLTGNVYNLS